MKKSIITLISLLVVLAFLLQAAIANYFAFLLRFDFQIANFIRIRGNHRTLCQRTALDFNVAEVA